MEWKEVRLGDIVSIKSGLAYKGAFIGKGENILLGMGCVSFKDKFLFSGARPYEADCDDKYCVEPGDIVLATRQQSDNLPILAMPAIIPASLKAKKIIYGTNLYKVENHSEVTNDFLFWQLKTPDYIDYISSVKTGSVVRMVTKKNVEDYVFRCPPKEVRDRISKLLWGLDRKIELNNKINDDLEEMAQAIFKNWFVDFEPFKDGKFVDSELGMIPEGWKVGTIGDIVEFQNGFTFSSKDFSENGEYKIITIKSVQDGCLVTEGSSKVTEYPTKMPAYCKLQSGDILLSLTGNVGRCCLVTETNLLLNQRVAKIKAKECYDNSFSYALFRLKETKELLISISRGTAQANLSPVEASKLPMVIPSEDARKSFSMISDSIMNKIISIHIENSRLSLLRDTLLPRLMSGEIEVPE